MAWTPPAAAFGFVRERATLHAAHGHAGSGAVLALDLKNFFGQISPERVTPHLATALDADVVAWFEGCAFIDGSLPPGLRTSPVLSNLAFADTDKVIEEHCTQHGVHYTRWVDDLAFSGAAVGDGFADEIQTILAGAGWTVNEAKTRVMRRSPYIYGLYVGGDVDRPHLPRWLKREMRLQVYFVSKYGASHFQREGAWSLPRLMGMLAYAGSVDPLLATQLRGQLQRAGYLRTR